MQQSHTELAGPNEALAALTSFITNRRTAGTPTGDLANFERALREKVQAVERAVLVEELERYDLDAPAVEVSGRHYRQVHRASETYFSSAGPIRVERNVYRASDGLRETVCPMELRAGIIDGRWTPHAAEICAFSVAHLTPGETEQLLDKVCGVRPSRSSLDRLPKALSIRWEAHREHFEEAIRVEEVIPAQAVSVGVSLDGVKTPMRAGQRKQKRAAARDAGKQTKGPAGYQDVGCGTISLYDAEGERLSTWRMARMPEPNKTTLKDTLQAEVESILAARPDLTLVKLADGARDNWTFLKDALPDGEECLDFYHAAEHLHAALVAAYGETHPKCHSQFEKLRTILRDEHDGVHKVIRALIYLRDKHPRRVKIAAELSYFRNNCHRMRYARLKAACLPIGSGVVEAACKTLVTQRLKRSGMRWSNDGGQAILTLRAAVQSSRFDRSWELLAQTYSHDAQPLGRVIPLRRMAA